MSEIKNSLVSFEIEMCFECPDDKGGQRIILIGIMELWRKKNNQKKSIVRIERVRYCMAEDDKRWPTIHY